MSLRTLIVKVMVLAGLLVGGYYLLAYKLAEGSVDYNYDKFTHRAGSMIIGLSRAHDGMVPKVIEKEFREYDIATPVLNFSFEKTQSPYGEVLFEAIKKKIDTTSRNGLFIFSVTPGNFLISKFLKDSPNLDLDEKTALAKLDNFNEDPNIEYIRKCYGDPLYKAFYPDKYSLRVIHDDGWIEFLDHLGEWYTVSEEEIELWKLHTKYYYRQLSQYEKKSTYRISQFERMIDYLKKRGHVAIVRMPADNDLIELENGFWPEFDGEMARIASKFEVPYINYTDEEMKYRTYDGAHLFGESAKEFTARMSKDIKDSLQLK